MIKIGKDYAINSDTENILLLKRYIGKSGESEGKERWKIIGYFSTPQNALRELVNQNVRDTGFGDMKTVCQKIDEVYSLIETLGIAPLASYTQKEGH